MLAKTLIILSYCFCTIQAFAQVPDSQTTEARAKALFEAGAYQDLDKLMQENTSFETRTESGYWQLNTIYRTLFRALHGEADDQAFWQSVDQKTQAFILQVPGSAAATFMRAEFFRQKAWNSRGETSAGEVPREAWALFRENMQLAEDALANNGAPFKDNPQWYVAALYVQGPRGARSQRFYDLLDEGLSKFPDYQPIYLAAVTFFEKRWSGDPDLVERFARLSVELTYETQGASLYAKIYIHLWEIYAPRINLFLHQNPDWDLMKQGMQDILERYPTEWNLQTFAHIACMKQDFPFMDSLFGQIHAEPIAAIWDDQFLFKSCSDTTMRPMTEEDLMRRMATIVLFTVLLELGYELQHR